MFDYQNQDENIKHYGQPTPPAYMTRIPNELPLFLSYGADINAQSFSGSELSNFTRVVQGIISEHESHEALPRSSLRVSSFTMCCGPRLMCLRDAMLICICV
ncbi:hypothetical protein DEO72_LG6g2038 [Vigna unguiculata]|uniref:Uncharacterized protein n=1 Tax=Vigna unguiculata TaxID=3917 RepID=A0A4D6MAA3_VIGUN|nr:hypothetical protein DEO72_LG6g2038 [Vigna unguiculata]